MGKRLRRFWAAPSAKAKHSKRQDDGICDKENNRGFGQENYRSSTKVNCGGTSEKDCWLYIDRENRLGFGRKSQDSASEGDLDFCFTRLLSCGEEGCSSLQLLGSSKDILKSQDKLWSNDKKHTSHTKNRV